MSEVLRFRVRRCRRCKSEQCHCQLQRKAYQKYVTGLAREAKLGRTTEMTFEEFWRWAEVHLQDKCAECSAEGSDLDHIVPLSKGGTHSIGNLQMLCRPCNGRKWAWLPGEVRDYSHLKRRFGR